MLRDSTGTLLSLSSRDIPSFSATPDESKHLKAAVTSPARKLAHARTLLKGDESTEGPALVDEEVAEAVHTSQPTVARVRRRYVEEGLEAALNRRPPTREYHRKLNGGQQARLIALAALSRLKAGLAGVLPFVFSTMGEGGEIREVRIRVLA